MRQREEQLTPTEIDLFNRFTTSRTAQGGRWTGTIKSRDGVEWIEVNAAEAGTLDGKQSLPGLVVMLRELLDGPESMRVESLQEQVLALKAQIQSLAAA
jgi:hypothetical protein